MLFSEVIRNGTSVFELIMAHSTYNPTLNFFGHLGGAKNLNFELGFGSGFLFDDGFSLIGLNHLGLLAVQRLSK